LGDLPIPFPIGKSANRQISKSANLMLEELEQEYLPLRDKVRELREYL
jgi:hypothetical protein